MEIGSESWKNLVYQGAKYLDVPLENDCLSIFADYVSILIYWNKKINLTAITDPFEIAVKHILDSIAPYHLVNNASSMLDVGSGAGLPGIPLKISIPSVKTTLIDSSRKKVNFQKYVIRKLGLKDISAFHARVDKLSRNLEPSTKIRPSICSLTKVGPVHELKRPDCNQFEVVICRALFSLERYVMSALPLITPTGRIVALKSAIDESTLQSLQVRLNQETDHHKSIGNQFVVSVRNYILPFIEAKRSIIVVQRE